MEWCHIMIYTHLRKWCSCNGGSTRCMGEKTAGAETTSLYEMWLKLLIITHFTFALGDVSVLLSTACSWMMSSLGDLALLTIYCPLMAWSTGTAVGSSTLTSLDGYTFTIPNRFGIQPLTAALWLDGYIYRSNFRPVFLALTRWHHCIYQRKQL